MDYEVIYQSPQELRAARIARQRRAQARKAKRRKYMIRRAIALVLMIAFITLLGMGVRALVVAFGATDVPQEVKYTETTAAIEVQEAMTKDEPLETIAEPEEPTTEDLLASGVLTDDISLTYELQMIAREASETFNIPYKLLLAVMFRESSYNPEASNGICYGLMQIHKINFDWLQEELEWCGVTDIKNNPKDNIYAGAYLLGSLIGKYGDYHKALMAYNCGEYRAKELWNEGYTSSSYSRNVLTTMDELQVAENITKR